MRSQAIYVGFRPYERSEKVLEDGTHIQSAKGFQYLFYCSDWNETGEIAQMGRTRFHTVTNEKEIEKIVANLPEIGGFCEVIVPESFGNQGQNMCQYIIK